MSKNIVICTFCKKSRSESLKMVVSGDFSICDKCIVLFNGLLKSTSQAEIKSAPQPEKKIVEQLNSIKIREFLDQYVIGQDTAKMAICVAVVNHYKRLLYEHGEDGVAPGLSTETLFTVTNGWNGELAPGKMLSYRPKRVR